VTVLVTGVGGGGHGHEIVKALRLARTRYRLVGTDVSPSSFGFRDVDTRHVLPLASDPGYVGALLDVCRKEGVQVLATGSEPELRAVATHRGLFQSEGLLVLVNSSAVLDACLDKWATVQRLAEKGFAVPESVLLENEDEWRRVKRLPAVVKPVVGGGGSQLVFVARDEEELRFFTRYLFKLGRRPLVQEYMGTPADEYTVGVLSTLDGTLVGSLAMRRSILAGLAAKTRVPRLGAEGGPPLALSSGISQGAIVEAPEVRKRCEEMAVALGSRGPFNVQVRWVDGEAVPFEINPRFSGTTGFRALAGHNEPDILIRHHLFGEPVPAVSYRCGPALRGLADWVPREGDEP
jgi:carbamoyl-phosphate synthase large subunit